MVDAIKERTTLFYSFSNCETWGDADWGASRPLVVHAKPQPAAAGKKGKPAAKKAKPAPKKAKKRAKSTRKK
jgi:hypothetical protein